ncbi:MAG: PAS domain S-box protein [Spirochaetota bacterium]|nr:PAS domain S-box protein [Spirochaetota bacterium]
MKTKNESLKRIEELRKRAASDLQKRIASLKNMSELDVLKMVHDLWANQIEMEVKNEELKCIKEDLEESKDKYSHLYDFAPIGYFTFNHQGVILEVNLTGTKLLGLNKKDLINKPFVDYIAIEDRSDFRSHIDKTFKHKSPQLCEIRLIKEDGKSFFAQLESIIIQDDDGNFEQCRSALSDITVRKKAERELNKHKNHLDDLVKKRTIKLSNAVDRLQWEISERKLVENSLRQSEQLYRAVVEDQTELIRRHLRNGTLTFVNDAYCRYFNAHREELLGKNFISIIYEDDREQFDSKINSLSIENPVTVVEYRIYDSDNNIRWQQWTERIIFNEIGEFIEYQAVGIDVTEQKKIAEELKMHREYLDKLLHEQTKDLIEVNKYLKKQISERKEIEEKLNKQRVELEDLIKIRTQKLTRTVDRLQWEIKERKIVEKALADMALFAEQNPAPLLRLDKKGIILLVNPSAQEIFKDEKLIGESWFKLCNSINQKDFNQLFKKKDLLQHEVQINLKTFFFTYRINPKNNQVNVYGADITDRIKAELELKKHRDKLNDLIKERTFELEKTVDQLQEEIAERKLTQEALRESHVIANALLNVPTESVFLMDIDGNILAANEVSAKRFNMTVEQIIGKNFRDILPLKVYEKRKKQFEKVIQSKIPVYFEDQRDNIWFDHSFYPIFDANDKVTKLAIFTHDITVEKKAKETKEKLEEEFARLTYQIHNSLKNKLESARNYLDDYIKNENNDINYLIKVNNLVSHCSEEAKNILFVIHNKECSYKILSDELVFRAELIFPLVNIAYSIKNKALKSIENKIIKPAIIQNILLIYSELLNNIVKHSDATETNITLDYKSNQLCLEIDDNGVGFNYDEELIKKGSYGLKMIKGLTESTNNKMFIKSEIGKASHCEIYFSLD